MDRGKNNPAPEYMDEATRPRKRRGSRGFRVLMAVLVAAVAFNATDGDFLQAGTLLTLGLFLVLQDTGLRERSAAWR